MLMTPRAAILLVFAAFGCIVGGHVGAIPVLIKNAQLTDYIFGTAQAFGMLASLVAMLVAGHFSRKFDHRSVILFALPMCFVALVYALLVQSPAAYFISIIFLAAILSVVDLNMNAEGAVIEIEVKKPIYTMFHASVSYAMAVSTLISSIVSVMIAPLASAVLAGVVVAWALYEVHRLVPHRPPHKEETQRFRDLPLMPLTWVGLTIGFSNACELASIMWAGQLLAELRPDLLAFSGLGMAFFGVCSGTVRLFGDRLRTYFGEINSMIYSLAIATFGMIVIGLEPGFLISVLAFALVGGGMAFIFPGLFSLAGRMAPKQRAAAMGFASSVSAGPRFVIPWVLGILAGSYSITIVFGATALFSLLSLLMVYFLLKPMAEEKGASSH